MRCARGRAPTSDRAGGGSVANCVVVRASPSFALAKYWGKADPEANLPATPSIAITVDSLWSQATVTAGSGDRAGSAPGDLVTVDGQAVPAARVAPFLAAARAELPELSGAIDVAATGNFPQAAGLASSASLFAAVAFGCAALVGRSDDLPRVSRIARVGSASAARSVYGGFSSLAAGATAARPELSANHWPELRLLVAIVDTGAKPVPSRDAMARVAATSPYYGAWVNDAAVTYTEIRKALYDRDLDRLGAHMRLSYLRMFGTMLSASPPINYLRPGSIAVLQALQVLRENGVGAWETMDAGPQVKVLTTEEQLPRVREALVASGMAPDRLIEAAAGEGPRQVDDDAALA